MSSIVVLELISSVIMSVRLAAYRISFDIVRFQASPPE